MQILTTLAWGRGTGWNTQGARRVHAPYGTDVLLAPAGEALAGLGLDEISEFQLHEDDGDFVGGELGGGDDFVDRLVVAVEGF